MGEFNQELFRKLLKKGIGTRTQKEFALKTGIAEGTISRMLNNETIPCPREKTLEILARNMNNVLLSELLVACGYDTVNINEAIKRFESDISDFFAFGDSNFQIFSDIEDIIHKIENFLRTKFEHTKIENETKDVPSNMRKKGAENKATLTLRWIYNEYFCDTKFDIYYFLSTGGRLFLIGSNIDIFPENVEKNQIRRTTLQKRSIMFMTPEERLLHVIFGNKENSYLPTVQIGHGFEMNETPEGFLDFLDAHADTFCDSEENIALYQRVIKGEDPEVVFKEYKDKGWETGIGAVIADIMRKETGDEYLYYKKEENLPEEEQNACVMKYGGTYSPNSIKKEDLKYLYECARELKLPSFGVVYYRSVSVVETDQVFKTDEFSL